MLPLNNQNNHQCKSKPLIETENFKISKNILKFSKSCHLIVSAENRRIEIK